jgi:hypothetical protein
MSIRMIALDLYRLHRKVEKLEQQVRAAPFEKQAMFKDRLRKARAERDQLRRALEGHKDAPTQYPKR